MGLPWTISHEDKMSWEKWGTHYDMSRGDTSCPSLSQFARLSGPPTGPVGSHLPPSLRSGQAPRSPQRDEGFSPFPANGGRCGVSSFRGVCGEGTGGEPLGDPEKLHWGRGAVERKGLLKGEWRSEDPKWGSCEEKRAPTWRWGSKTNWPARQLWVGLPLF